MAGVVAAAALAAIAEAAPGQTPAAPPVAPVRPVTDDYYGIKVVDPYRYMESLKDTTVDRWFREENAYTRAVLDRNPARDEHGPATGRTL